MSALADELAFQFKACRMKPEREYRFHPERKWRFDFCFPEARLAIEVDGGIFVQGRHSRGVGMLADMEKQNAAVELGWKLFRYGKQHIKSGEALAQIERVLKESILGAA